MPHYDDPKHTFLNRRDWNSFLSKLQSPASYPMVIQAVKSSRAWFSLGAADASEWLGGNIELAEKLTP